MKSRFSGRKLPPQNPLRALEESPPELRRCLLGHITELSSSPSLARTHSLQFQRGHTQKTASALKIAKSGLERKHFLCPHIVLSHDDNQSYNSVVKGVPHIYRLASFIKSQDARRPRAFPLRWVCTDLDLHGLPGRQRRPCLQGNQTKPNTTLQLFAVPVPSDLQHVIKMRPIKSLLVLLIQRHQVTSHHLRPAPGPEAQLEHIHPPCHTLAFLR